MTEIVCSAGLAAATMTRVIDLASVSRSTFYSLFANREECLAAVLDTTVARARLRVRDAWEAAPDSDEATRAGLLELLRFFEEDRQLARFCLGMGGDERLLARRARVLAELAEAVDGGRQSATRGRELPHFTSIGVIGAALAILQAHLLRQDEQPLPELWGPLMAVIVLPYRGLEAARRELVLRPPPTRGEPPAARNGNAVLEQLPIRLTYRTTRVLAVIAEQPGATSADIARAAGIRDHGQTSKLLSRLQGLELIENLAYRDPKHAPKSWRLTEKGATINAIVRGAIR